MGRHGESQDDTATGKLVWVRKRDGSVVAFDESKLASSILAARRTVDPENAALAAQELAQAVAHFLHLEFGGGVAGTSEIVETVVKVLRETGQGATAAAYFDHGRDHRRRRSQLRVTDANARHADTGPQLGRDDSGRVQGMPPTADTAEHSASTSPGLDAASEGAKTIGSEPGAAWDKSNLATRLVEELDLDPEFARQIAAEVERKLLSLHYERVGGGLIRELIASELSARGVSSVRLQRRHYGPEPAQIARWLEERQSSEALFRRAGRVALGDYAVDHFYSGDIAGLMRDGLLVPFDGAAPGHWAALSFGTLDLAGRCECVDEFLEKTPTEFAGLARRVEGTIAIEAFDATVALLERSPVSAGDLAAQCMAALEACARQPGVRIVLNLHGCIPDGLADALGDGPLFAVRATEQQERLASSLARELVERIAVARSRLENVRVDFHPDLRADREDFALGLRPFAKHLVNGDRFRTAFDRGACPIADGLWQPPNGRAAVYTYVGVNLEELLKGLGDARDEATFFERLGWLVDSAVRAAGQKREFLRQRQPELFAGRDHERSAFVLVPMGLDATVTAMLGQSIAAFPASLAFARQIVDALAQRLRRATRALHLAWRIDDVPAAESLGHGGSDAAKRTGPSTAGKASGWKRDLQAFGQLHQITGGGTAWLGLDADRTLQANDLIESVAFGAFDSKVCRIGFVPTDPARQQPLAADWLGN